MRNIVANCWFYRGGTIELPRPLLRLVTLFFVIIICLSTGRAALALEVGSVAPDFELRTLAGQHVRLSDYRGAPVILKLATTWCPSCQQQDRAIDALGAFLVKHDIALVEVFIGEDEAVVRRSRQGRSYPFRHVALLDPSGDVFNGLYQGYAVPRVLLLDSRSRIRHDGTLITEKRLRSKLQRLVTEDLATDRGEKKV